MDNNEFNDQETGVFNSVNPTSSNNQNNELNNSALGNQVFMDDSLNNFGQTPVNSQVNITPINDVTTNTNASIPSQPIQSEEVNTIFSNDQPQVVDNGIQPSVSQPINNIVEEPKVSEPVANNTEAKKKSKGSLLVIMFLLIIILGLVGYITYDKFFSNTSSDTKSEEKETNGLTKVKDTKLIEELRSGLITSNKVSSLYYSSIKATDVNNKNLIGFNVVKYIDDNNITLNNTDTVYKDTNYKLNMTVSKANLNDYINNKYNTNLEYLYTSKDNNDFVSIGCNEVIADENNYYYVTMPKGCGLTKIATKLVKAEEDKDYIYIYDNYVKCSTETGWSGCVLAEDEVLGINSTVSCNEDGQVDEKCPIKGTVDEMSNYVLTNMQDKLKTYKHTFKKLDGNYFWVSSENIN